MSIKPISEWTLYKHRFLVAYTGLGILTALLLCLFAQQMPPGLSTAEQQSVVTSHQLSFTQLPSAAQVVDLPYHALQKASVALLGLTPFGVRLPSIVFAIITAACLSFIIKRWFKVNVAIIASLLMITSCWYLSLSRLGTPDIMIPFWTSLLILCATYVSQQTKKWHVWKALFGLSAALSLYTPYMAYLFIATLIAATAQPHLRYLIRQSSKVGLTIGVFFFVAILAPLALGIYKDPNVLRAIFAIPASLPEPAQFARDLLQAMSNLGNPFNVTAGQFITPMVGVAMLTLIIIGGVRLLSDFHSVRAYVLLIWTALLIPIIGFTPSNITVLFVPSILVMTIGLSLVVRYWYRLFPINPYARIFGLLPLFILVFSMVQFDYQRYTGTMLNSPSIGKAFSTDAFMAQTEANKLPSNASLTIVAPAPQQALYAVIASNRTNTYIATGASVPMRSGAYLVAESEVKAATPSLPPLNSLIVNDRKEDALRFRFYQ